MLCLIWLISFYHTNVIVYVQSLILLLFCVNCLQNHRICKCKQELVFICSHGYPHTCMRVAGTGVSVFSLHPGVVQSDLWRHQHQCIQVAVKIFRVFTKTTVEGAQTTIYCAVQPGLESQSGGYFRYKPNFSQLVIQKLSVFWFHAALYFLPADKQKSYCPVCSSWLTIVSLFNTHTQCNTQCVMAIFCPYVCSVTALPQGAQGLLLMTTWPRNCGRSAATCSASPGSEQLQTNYTGKNIICYCMYKHHHSNSTVKHFHRGIKVDVTVVEKMYSILCQNSPKDIGSLPEAHLFYK